MQQNEICYLAIESHGVSGEVLVNGGPILILPPCREFSAFPTVNQWVVSGENAIELHVDSPVPEFASITIKVRSGVMGAFPGESTETEYGELKWSASEVSTQTATIAITHRFSLSHKLGMWHWESAPVLSMSNTLQSAAIAKLHYIRDLFEAREMSKLLEEFELKSNEIDRAFYNSVGTSRGEFENVVENFFGSPDWSMEEISEDSLSLRLACDGRLVGFRSQNLLPPLRSKNEVDGVKLLVPMLFARSMRGLIIAR